MGYDSHNRNFRGALGGIADVGEKLLMFRSTDLVFGNLGCDDPLVGNLTRIFGRGETDVTVPSRYSAEIQPTATRASATAFGNGASCAVRVTHLLANLGIQGINQAVNFVVAVTGPGFLARSACGASPVGILSRGVALTSFHRRQDPISRWFLSSSTSLIWILKLYFSSYGSFSLFATGVAYMYMCVSHPTRPRVVDILSRSHRSRLALLRPETIGKTLEKQFHFPRHAFKAASYVVGRTVSTSPSKEVHSPSTGRKRSSLADTSSKEEQINW